MVLTAPQPVLAIIFAKLLIAAREVFQKHVFWAYFSRKIRIIFSIDSTLYKLETKNLNVRSTTDTVLRISTN